MNNSKHNQILVNILKGINECQWNGSTIHDTIEACAVAINLSSSNSGAKTPNVAKITGLTGYFVILDDGNINFEARIIKEDADKFKIEYLSNTAYNDLEREYSKNI